MTRRPLIAISLIFSTIMVVVWFTSVPLGVPAEWQWGRHAAPAGMLPLLDRFCLTLPAGGLLWAVSLWGYRSLRKATVIGVAGRYVLLFCVGSFWLYAVQQSAPPLHRTLKPLWVLYDTSSSGYFYEAVFEIESTSEFLRGYEDRMKEGEVLHIGTHPPGLFFLSRACLAACHASPVLCRAVNQLTPQEVRSAFRTVEADARLHRPLTDTERAGLQLLSLITFLATALTMFPLIIICRSCGNETVAWQAATLWLTLPCLAVFLPKSDLLFPLTASLCLMFAWLGMQAGGLYRYLWAACCGVVLWTGLLMSLAHIPVVVALCSLVVLQWIFRSSPGKTLLVLAVAGSTIGALSLVWYGLTDCNLVSVWKLNLQNHEGFYGQYERTWWKWALVNPLELIVAVGPVVAVAAMNGTWRAMRSGISRLRMSNDHPQPTPLALITLALAATWMLLWLSGKNQGEAARLWCFLTPWLLIAASVPNDAAATSDKNAREVLTAWPWALALQIACAAGVVSRVSGFSF